VCDFSRSSLWQLICTVVKYGLLLLWHTIPQKPPPCIRPYFILASSKPPLHTSFILASSKLLGVKKLWHSLRALQNRSDANLFLLLQMHHTILEQFTFFKRSSSWESCVGWPLQTEVIHGLIRFCTRSKISLRSNSFRMPYNLVV
jgi:hypothetical protein